MGRAELQHAGYERTLSRLGARVVRLPAAPELPDAVFVEDTALVLDELAVITRPGAASRRPETAAVAALLEQYRPLRFLTPPATLDGGDVLALGRTLYVGQSSRSSPAGIAELERCVAPHGYQVRAVAFRGCLHLKSAVTQVAERLLLANPSWVAAEAFPDREVVPVDPREPYAANALRVGATVILPAHFPHTRERLVARGLDVVAVECGELAKAEGGVTCCSLLFAAPPAAAVVDDA